MKQLVHESAVRSSRYESLGKFAWSNSNASFVLSMLLWFSSTRIVVWLSSLLTDFLIFSSMRILVLLSVGGFLKFSKNFNFNYKFGTHSFSAYLHIFVKYILYSSSIVAMSMCLSGFRL